MRDKAPIVLSKDENHFQIVIFIQLKPTYLMFSNFIAYDIKSWHMSCIFTNVYHIHICAYLVARETKSHKIIMPEIELNIKSEHANAAQQC